MLRRHSSLELCEGQRVSIWILEPGDLGAGWRRPDAVFVLIEKLVPLEANGARHEVADGTLDVRDLPAQYGIAGRLQLPHNRHAEQCPGGIERQGKPIFAHKAQAERL